MTETAPAATALDPAVPNVARMYDFMLGGKENDASDRAAVARLIELEPAVPRFARLNRDFLGRAVRFAAEDEIAQFLDVGAGLPTQESVHQVAQAIRPDARVVYVDNDLSYLRTRARCSATIRTSPSPLAMCATRPRSWLAPR